jgi:hypothetical protein
MAALDTVGKIIGYARTLLQDTYEPAYRYPTADLIDALNAGLLDARRLRPDLFLYTPTNVPFYTTPDEVIDLDQQYRLALVYFILGTAQFRDEEDVTDARAGLFMLKFTSMLIEPMMPQSVART